MMCDVKTRLYQYSMASNRCSSYLGMNTGDVILVLEVRLRVIELIIQHIFHMIHEM